jgi:hypothetical protein
VAGRARRWRARSLALPGLRLELALRIVWRGGDDRRKLREALYAIAY